MEKEIVGYNGRYVASSDGKIFSIKKSGKKELIGKVTRCGYRMIILSNGKKNYYLAHRIIAKLFISNPDNLPTVNHKDGNKLNNDITNLEWASYPSNLKHARDMGLTHAIINFAIAEEIRMENLSHQKIADRYGISKTEVGYIKLNKRWTK